MDKITDYKTIGEKYGNKDLSSNKKFGNVKSVIDTGSTIKNVQVLSDGYVAKRKGELFKRIKASVVVKLLGVNNNSESIYQLKDESQNNDEGFDNSKVTNTVNTEDRSVYSQRTDLTAKTGRTNKTTTKTAITSITYATEMLGNLEDLTFIILDFREKSEYDNVHIREAISFPAANILRDKFLTEMYSFKNKEDKLIIVYDSEERLGIPHAQLLFQKGFDNIFFVSGGLEDFVKVYPEMCEGPGVPALINAKAQLELLKKDAPLRSTNKSNFSKIVPVTNGKSRAKSSDKLSVVTSSKISVVSGTSNISKANNLKNNLKK